jgi:hypothetical protein
LRNLRLGELCRNVNVILAKVCLDQLLDVVFLSNNAINILRTRIKIGILKHDFHMSMKKLKQEKRPSSDNVRGYIENIGL